MHSLLEKALEIRRRIEAEDPFFFSDSEEEELDTVPAEERKKILSQLDTVVSKNRGLLTAEQFTFTPLHKDSVIPAVVNIVSLLLLVILSSVFFISFNIDRNNIIAVSEYDNSAGGKIIEVLRKESEAKLKEKEGEISLIQSRLATLREAHESVLQDTDEKIRQIEAEMKLDMEAELEAERIRLRNEGFSEEEIRTRIIAVENQYQSRLEIRLEEYAAEQDIIKTELNRQITEYEARIGTAQSDAALLEKDLAAYKAESEVQQQESSLQKERLESLKRERREEKLITDQINAGYTEAGNLLKEKKYEEASISLDNLENFINSPEISSFQFMSERRGMDFLMIGSLRKLAEVETGQNTVFIPSDSAAVTAVKADPETLKNADNFLQIGKLMNSGNESYRNNDIESAGKSYETAFSILPELGEGVDNILNIEKSRQFDENMEKIKLSVAERERLENLGEKENSRIALSRNLDKFRKGIIVSDSERSERMKTLVPLLQTKLKVRRILSADSDLNDDPELFRKLEQYIRAYGREKESEGIEKGLNEVNSIIRSILNSDVSVYYQVDENRELEFFFLMDGFEKLIGY